MLQELTSGGGALVAGRRLLGQTDAWCDNHRMRPGTAGPRCSTSRRSSQPARWPDAVVSRVAGPTRLCTPTTGSAAGRLSIGQHRGNWPPRSSASERGLSQAAIPCPPWSMAATGGKYRHSAVAEPRLWPW